MCILFSQSSFSGCVWCLVCQLLQLFQAFYHCYSMVVAMDPPGSVFFTAIFELLKYFSTQKHESLLNGSTMWYVYIKATQNTFKCQCECETKVLHSAPTESFTPNYPTSNPNRINKSAINNWQKHHKASQGHRSTLHSPICQSIKNI